MKRREESMEWSERAWQLADSFPLSSLHPAVCSWLKTSFSKGPVGIACSGGADSLCLLLLLWAHFPDRREDFLVLHFDHRLRGEESLADAQFVAAVARELGLKFRRGTWQRRETETVTEDSARQARFAFFEKELPRSGQRMGGAASVVFLGHQRDDIAENLLMRLSRGSGTRGLAAPRPVQLFSDGRVRLRPLLALPGTEIRRVLNERGIPHRLDVTNLRAGFYRNRIRLNVLPRWQGNAPFDVLAGAAASRELLEEDDEALGVWLRELLPEPVAGKPLDLQPLAGKPRALLRRALHEWLLREGLSGRLAKPAFERLLLVAEKGEELKMSAGTGAFIEIRDRRLLQKTIRPDTFAGFFEKPWPLCSSGEILLPGGRSLRARFLSLGPDLRERILAGRVDCRTTAYLAREESPLWVRHRRPGDRFRSLGAPGARKLQDLFVDRKVPAAERSRLPVVFVGSKIVWVPGFPPAEASKINKLTKAVVQLTYDGGGTV